MLHHAGAHRIQVNVAAHLQQIGILINQNRLESTLKQMPHLAVAPVIRLGVDAVDVAHQHGQVRATGMQNQVVMVIHQAIGQGADTKPVKRCADLAPYRCFCSTPSSLQIFGSSVT